MSFSFYDQSPDSLAILLNKVNAVKTVNQENLAFIQSRKGHDVITKQSFTLRPKSSTNDDDHDHDHDDTDKYGKLSTQEQIYLNTHKQSENSKKAVAVKKRSMETYDDDQSKRKKVESQNKADNQHDLFTVSYDTCTKTADDIIASWRYHGEPLTKLQFVTNNNSNIRLWTFDDLVHIHKQYEIWLDEYSLKLTDTSESRAIVECVLRDMELLQVAIGSIHGEVLDIVDMDVMNDEVMLFMKTVSAGLKRLQSKMPVCRLDDVCGQIYGDDDKEEDEYGGIVEFDDCRSLVVDKELRLNLEQDIHLQPYVLDGKPHIAIGSYHEIILWDLTSNEEFSLFTNDENKRRYAILSLALYKDNEVPMLVSGHQDNKIKIWDLHNKTNIDTLDRCSRVQALATWKRDGKNFLATGGHSKIIDLWHLESHSLVTTLTCNCNDVRNLKVYYHDEKPYLVHTVERPIANENTMLVWCLTEYKLRSTLDGHKHDITSLVVINDDVDKKVRLASGDLSGYVKVWDMKSYDCILSFQTYYDGYVTALEVIRSGEKICLVTSSSARDENIKVWDVNDGSMISCIDSKGYVYNLKAFMIGDRSCLAIKGLFFDSDDDDYVPSSVETYNAVKLLMEHQK